MVLLIIIILRVLLVIIIRMVLILLMVLVILMELLIIITLMVLLIKIMILMVLVTTLIMVRLIKIMIHMVLMIILSVLCACGATGGALLQLPLTTLYLQGWWKRQPVGLIDCRCKTSWGFTSFGLGRANIALTRSVARIICHTSGNKMSDDCMKQQTRR
jgi:hypothetical protein